VKEQGNITVEARLLYRQADQKVAGKLLHAVPEDIDLEKTYGINSEVVVPIVEMTRIKASFSTKGK